MPRRSLLLAAALLLAPAACAPTADEPAEDRPAEEPAPAASADRMAALERALHGRVNRHRESRGLPRLAFDERLAEIARGHSRDMAAGRVPFSHDGFEARAEAVRRHEAYQSLAENVATNDFPRDTTAAVAVEGWLGSAGHRRNLEGRWSRTGIGAALAADGRTFYYTQLFLR